MRLRPGAPIRRRSGRKGFCEAGFWRPFNREIRSKFLFMLQEFERDNRQEGRRYGPIGSVAIEVMRELTKIVDYKTGRLEVAISTICTRIKRCRAAVVNALAALRNAGFLDWIRRYDVADTAGRRGPQLRQVSNAYRIIVPASDQPAPPAADFWRVVAARRKDLASTRRLNTPAALDLLAQLEAAARAALDQDEAAISEN